MKSYKQLTNSACSSTCENLQGLEFPVQNYHSLYHKPLDYHIITKLY